ncbi:hypothetical protein Fmac_029690 [Flemingia macrophylla]|uniref:Rho termination factor N-terminal domain-containing protein n=1 Tax=Flemingia macrophylla TaxID=520843 RepID=A0ABD1LB72_9FABA
MEKMGNKMELPELQCSTHQKKRRSACDTCSTSLFRVPTLNIPVKSGPTWARGPRGCGKLPGCPRSFAAFIFTLQPFSLHSRRDTLSSSSLSPFSREALNLATSRNPRARSHFAGSLSFPGEVKTLFLVAFRTLFGYSYLQFMAWDLWSSSYGQVASGISNSSQHTECDFYIGCGRDVIEEDALNEKSCVQVLRILITKADTEIEELERDLLLLQNELACTEHEKWPDICCGALTERINLLDVAVSTLKNDCVDDAEMQQLLHGEPAETLNEIVKALQRDHCRYILAQQYLDMDILSSIVNVTEHALDKDTSTGDCNIIIKEEEKGLNVTSESSGGLELLLELHENRSDNPEKIEELSEKCLARSPNLGDIICGPDHSDGMRLSETSDNKVTGNEVVRRSQLINTDTGQTLDFFSTKDNGNIPSEAKKENEHVKEKDVSSDDLRPAIGVKGRKEYLHSRLDTSQQRKSRKSNEDKKLRGFAPKTARRACRKESKVAPDEDSHSLNLPLQVVYPQKIADAERCSFKGSNGNNSGQVSNTTLIHAENSALVSLIGMQTKSALYTGLQLIDEEKQAQDLKSQIAANLSKSNTSFHSKLIAQEKKKLELEAFSSGEPHDSYTEVIPSTPTIVSTKRQRKRKPCTDVAILKESITRRAVEPDKHETEGRAIVLYDSKFSELQKKKRVSKLPITVDIQNSTLNLDNGSQVDLHTIKSHSLVDSHNETSPLLHNTHLNDMRLTDLRALAKEHNVTKYYNLRKEALVGQLSERLGRC